MSININGIIGYAMPIPQYTRIHSGNLAIDNAKEVKTETSMQSEGVSHAEKIDSMPKYEPSRTYITFRNDQILGLYGGTQLKSVAKYNQFVAQNAYGKKAS